MYEINGGWIFSKYYILELCKSWKWSAAFGNLSSGQPTPAPHLTRAFPSSPFT